MSLSMALLLIDKFGVFRRTSETFGVVIHEEEAGRLRLGPPLLRRHSSLISMKYTAIRSNADESQCDSPKITGRRFKEGMIMEAKGEI